MIFSTDNIITIIGKGRFGGYLGMLLNRLGYDIHFRDVGEAKVHPNSLMVIFAVPIASLKATALIFKDSITSDMCVVDVCSVKEYSVDVFDEVKLDAHVTYTHPLFGPQSAPTSCHGQRIVVCNTTGPIFNQVFFRDLKLVRIDRSAMEHDREMAKTQVINHVVGRAAQHMDIDRSLMSTATHEKFMDIVDIVTGNSIELFRDMFKYNRFAKIYTEQFINSIKAVTE